MTRGFRFWFIPLVFVLGLVVIARAADFDTAQANALEEEIPDDAIQADPVITIWYGENQTFGSPGLPQRQMNILGNAANTSVLSYRLNNGSTRILSMGADTRRLERNGDFVIDLLDSELNDGSNAVVIIADGSRQVERTVIFTYERSQSWPETYNLNWNNGAGLTSMAQIVDGKWRLTTSGIRTQEIGYDRLIAIGDIGWRDYEVVVPITIHAKDNNGFYEPSFGPAVGILMRWSGHTDRPVVCTQPKCGWEPFGAIAWYRWLDPLQPNTGELYLFMNSTASDYEDTGKQLSFGVTYLFKVQVETQPDGRSVYRMRVWPQGSIEPGIWDVSATDQANYATADDPTSGSLLLLAHHVDATFGNVSVTPLAIPGALNGVSDDFNACLIDPEVWTTVDPLGTSIFQVEGGYAGNAGAAIHIPAGSRHIFDPPTHQSARLLQSVEDGDFTLEVKIDSSLNGNSSHFTPVQGILVESTDTNRWLRVEFSSQGDGTRLKVITHERTGLSSWSNTIWLNEVVAPDGIQPMSLRVTRYGSRYRIAYKILDSAWIDRINLPLHMAIGKIGMYAGNAAGNPSLQEHTAVFDYFQFTDSEFLRPDDVRNNLEIIITGQGDVAVQPFTESYACFTAIELTAQPAPGFSFDRWMGDLAGSTSPATIIMNEPKSVTTTFTANTYDLTVQVGSNGTVTISPEGPYGYSEVVTLTALPEAGYVFQSWSGSLSDTSNPVMIVMNDHKTVGAAFIKRQLLVDVAVVGSGDVDREPDTDFYNYGESLRLEAIPQPDWYFSGWSGAASGDTNPVTILIEADTEITAHFEPFTKWVFLPVVIR